MENKYGLYIAHGSIVVRLPVNSESYAIPTSTATEITMFWEWDPS